MTSYSEALLVERNEGPDAAAPLMEALAAGHPENVEATMWLVRRRLLQDDPQADARARALIKRVPAAEDMLMEDLAAWLVRHGRAGEAMDLEAAIVTAAVQNHPGRSDLDHGDTVLPHGITESRLAFLRQEFGKISTLHTAAAVRKHLPDNSNRPMYVFAVRLRGPDRERVMLTIASVLRRAIGHRGDWTLYGAHPGLEGWQRGSAVLAVPGAVIHPPHHVS